MYVETRSATSLYCGIHPHRPKSIHHDKKQGDIIEAYKLALRNAAARGWLEILWTFQSG